MSLLDQSASQLRSIKVHCDSDPDIMHIIAERENVRNKYRATFSRDKIAGLTENEFQEFLQFRNNKHWTGLQRQGHKICENMEGLRRSLTILHGDEPIEERWEQARNAATNLGRATLSAIIHIIFPADFGIWNGPSEEGLQQIGFWPDFPRGVTEGGRYKMINDHLLQLAERLNLDLWDLDAIMGGLKKYRPVMFKEDIPPDLMRQSPQRRERIVEEFWRNAKEVKWLKEKYDNRCQICNSIPFDSKLGEISEAHHIHWLSCGGTDSRENMILLCPNHHAAMHMSDPPPFFDRENLTFRFPDEIEINVPLDFHLKKSL